MNNNLVLKTDDGPVRLLTLNRPERRNALNRVLMSQLGDELDHAAITPSVRVLILNGAGTCFCAGMDLSRAAIDHDADESEAIDDANMIADLIDQVHMFPKPTIAALNGDAFGGGAGLALCCDVVIAADQARIGYPEVQRGLVAAVVLHDLVRLAGLVIARRLLLTGEPISARDAVEHGLIQATYPSDHILSSAIDFAKTLTRCAPMALATTKRLLDEATNRPKNLRGAAAVSAAIRVSEEATEGIRAFFEKRPPEWFQPT